jgi:DNA-binding transcriptional LysR family regulator
VEFHPLADAPPYALVAEAHRLAGAAEVALAELAEEPFVLLDLPLSRDYFLDLFRTADVEPDVARQVGDAELARSLVAWGYGYTLANARPAPTRAVDGTPLRALRLRTASPPPRIGLARRAGLEPTRSATAFAAAFADVVSERWEARP